MNFSTNDSANKIDDIESLNVLHNLPLSNIDNYNFVGRETEQAKLLESISPDYRQHINVVNGMGGIGKTSLALQVANLCRNPSKQPNYIADLEIPAFKAIIFVSIKKSYFDFNNEIRQVYQDSSLQYIFKEIAATLEQSKNNTNKINQTSGEKQIQEVYRCLNQQDTLLIIDNLDAAKDKESILLFLSNLPENVQAIITTRDEGFYYSSVPLNPLLKKAGLQLIKQQSEAKKVVLTAKEAQDIFRLSGGIPLAIVYAIGQKKASQKINFSLIKSISSLLDNFTDNKTASLFKKSQELFDNEIEQKLFIAISLFPHPPRIEAIAEIVGVEANSPQINQALDKLIKLSLIEQRDTRYLMHPITREYIAKELLQYCEFEKGARERWVKWYFQFAQKYGGRDWQNWQKKYDQLNAEWNNLLAVLEWCAGKGHYESVKSLWQQINQFSNLYGYLNDRIFWLNWLIEESNKREDWKTSAYCRSEKGFTLIQMGDLANAESLLNKAFRLVKTFDLSNENSENQTLICQHFVLLYIKQKKYKLAYYWLQQEKICAEDTRNITQQELLRRLIAINTLNAEILLRQERYPEAKELYEKVVREAAQIGWHRRKNQAQEKIRIIQTKLPTKKSRRIQRSRHNSSYVTKQKELDIPSFSINNLAG